MKENGHVLKIELNLTNHLSCQIVFNKKKNEAWIVQHHLIKIMKQKFRTMVKSLKTYKTSGTPNMSTIGGSNDGKIISPEKQVISTQGYHVAFPCEAFTSSYCIFHM